MAERTKRGDEERKAEDKELPTGKPVTSPNGKAGKQPANTTRDKDVKPAKDDTGDDDAAEES